MRNEEDGNVEMENERTVRTGVFTLNERVNDVKIG